jgi:hypothetical protein
MTEVPQILIQKQILLLYDPLSLLQAQAPTIPLSARIDDPVLPARATEPPSCPIHGGSMSDSPDRKEMKHMSRSAVFSAITTSYLQSIPQKFNVARA